MSLTISVAADLLRIIDAGLKDVLAARGGFLQCVAVEYAKYRSARTKVGFEQLVSAELYVRYQKNIQDDTCVYYEYPGIEKDSIDICLSVLNSTVYLENKMYYSTSPEGYGRDFKKLKAMVDEPATLCVWVQFNYYPNKNNPVLAVFKRKRAELIQLGYETRLRTIGRQSKPHFARMAFWHSNKRNSANKTVVGTSLRAAPHR